MFEEMNVKLVVVKLFFFFLSGVKCKRLSPCCRSADLFSFFQDIKIIRSIFKRLLINQLGSD